MITDFTPLAERMRPKHLDEVVGQEHLTGPAGILRKILSNDYIPSMLFWGPPGSGKTTLAQIIASMFNRPFYQLSAVSAGVKDFKEILSKHPKGSLFRHAPIVFIDEIHRFNKAQQDALLYPVETGQIVLIGATTENPGFEINNALLSRMHTFVLHPLDKTALLKILERALEKDTFLQTKKIKEIDKEAIIQHSSGDVRKMLNILELAVRMADNHIIDGKLVRQIAEASPAMYDKKSDWHYDIISAFIKSVRGSDPDAALYWLARMIEGGEDPLFIARRLIILAAEDIGLANPNALLLAQSAFEAVERIGMPEGRIVLSEVTIYLAMSPKSNSAYMAIKEAQKFVKETGDLPVPLHLRNAANRFMREQGYGKGYLYPHDYPGNFVEQNYLPRELKDLKFYRPGMNINEEKMRQIFNAFKKHQKEK